MKIGKLSMEDCDYALLNIVLTTVTAVLESTQAKNKQEIPLIILRRIRENKTAESIVNCTVNKKKCVCG